MTSPTAKLSAGTTSPISQLLAAELLELQKFRALLVEEKVLLQNGDAEGLPSLTERKSALAARLGELLRDREQALTSTGFKPGREGMEAWLVSQPAAAPAHAEWQHLLKLAEETRREHDINGKLIAMHLQHNQQALAVLMSAGGRPLTYGPDGQQRGGGGGRTLGSA